MCTCTCEQSICQLTLTSFSWLLILLNLPQVFLIRSVSLSIYNLDSPYLVHTLMMEGTCAYIYANVTVIYVSFQVQWNLYKPNICLFQIQKLVHMRFCLDRFCPYEVLFRQVSLFFVLVYFLGERHNTSDLQRTGGTCTLVYTCISDALLSISKIFIYPIHVLVKMSLVHFSWQNKNFGKVLKFGSKYTK